MGRDWLAKKHYEENKRDLQAVDSEKSLYSEAELSWGKKTWREEEKEGQ